jgi:hypothetical protein
MDHVLQALLYEYRRTVPPAAIPGTFNNLFLSWLVVATMMASMMMVVVPLLLSTVVLMMLRTAFQMIFPEGPIVGTVTSAGPRLII